MLRSKPFYLLLGLTGLCALTLSLLVGARPTAQGDPLRQGDPTEFQLTLDAAVQQALEQTAAAQSVQATPNITATFEAALWQAVTATAQAAAGEAPVGQAPAQQSVPAAQNFQPGGSPGSTPVPENPIQAQPVSPTTSNDFPANPPVITSYNVTQVEELYRVGDGKVYQFELAPDGRQVALGGAAGIRLLDPANLNAEPRLIPTEYSLYYGDVAWSPDGARIAAGYDNGMIQILDVLSGTILANLTGHSDTILQLAWSPDGTRLASTSSDNSSILWDALTGNQVWVLESFATDNFRNYAAWSPTGRTLAIGGEDGIIRLYEGQAGSLLRTMDHTDWVNCVQWSPDGSQLLSAGDDNTVHIWDPATGLEVQTLHGVVPEGREDATYALWRAVWSPDGQRIAASNWYQLIFVPDILIWDVNSGMLVGEIDTGELSALRNIAWLDNTHLLGNNDEWLVSYDTFSGQQTAERRFAVPVARYVYPHVTWSPDGQQFAMAMSDNQVHIYDAATHERVRTLSAPTGQQILQVVWSPLTPHLVGSEFSPDEDNSTAHAYVWNVESGAVEAEFTGRYHNVGWSPDGRYVALFSNATGMIEVYDAHSSWNMAYDLFNGGEWTWSPDVAWLVAAGVDRVQFYDGHTGEWVRDFELPRYYAEQFINGVSYAPGGQFMAVSSRRAITIFGPDETINTALEPTSGIFVDWSPDGSLYVIYDQYSLKFYRGGSNMPIMTVPASEGLSVRVGQGWSPDGSRLAMPGQDGFIHVYGVAD